MTTGVHNHGEAPVGGYALVFAGFLLLGGRLADLVPLEKSSLHIMPHICTR